MTDLKPLFKWSGGKRKEIPIIKEFLPSKIDTYVEPFVGGGALFFYLNHNNNVINDIDFDVTNFYKQIKKQDEEFVSQLKKVQKEFEQVKHLSKEKRGELYYRYRDMDKNNGLSKMDGVERAIRFIVITSLAFNGMRRFNKKGEFNIPFGNYKTLSLENCYNKEYIKLFEKTIILNKSFPDVIKTSDTVNNFIFIDPPYTRTFKSYTSDGEFPDSEHEKLADIFHNLKNAKAMVVINSDDFTRSLYKKYIKKEYEVKYSTNIKNRYDNNAKHLLITNY